MSTLFSIEILRNSLGRSLSEKQLRRKFFKQIKETIPAKIRNENLSFKDTHEIKTAIQLKLY